MADVILKAEHLKIGFFSERHSLFEKRKRNEVLKDLSFTMEKGEVLGLVGESGCGKSTLAKVILGLLKPDSGTVIVSGNRPQMVFQDPYASLHPNHTLWRTLAEPLQIHGIRDVAPRVTTALEQVGLAADAVRRYPHQLSGGQRQRVAIGRAIVRNPRVFMFDEPLSNLDAELRVDMRLHIARLHQELKTTMVYVTHDQVEAMTLADKIVVMNYGKVEQMGSPMALYYNPVNKFVAGFIGSPKMNFLPAIVSDWQPERLTVTLAQDHQLALNIATQPLKPGAAVTLGIRPEHLTPEVATGTVVEFQCEVVERLGNNTYLFGQCYGHDNVKVLLPGDVHFRPWQKIKLAFDERFCMVFDENDLRISADIPAPDAH